MSVSASPIMAGHDLRTRRLRRGVLFVSIACAVGLTAIGGLYVSGNATVVRKLCKLGLPNLSVPQGVREELDQPCIIYGRRERFSGVFSAGFEEAAFYPYPFAEEAFVRHGIEYSGFDLWFTQNDLKRLVDGHPREPLGGLSIRITFEGRPSISEGRFGHLGVHKRQILVDQVISSGPVPEPSESDIARWRSIIQRRH